MNTCLTKKLHHYQPNIKEPHDYDKGYNWVAFPKIDINEKVKKILQNTPPLNNLLLYDEIMGVNR